MYCKLCSDYIGIMSLAYLCNYCSNVRRIILLFGKTRFADVIHRTFSVNLTDTDLEISIDNDEKEITNLKKSKTIDNLMQELQKRRAKIE
jgi:hypothetical protein